MRIIVYGTGGVGGYFGGRLAQAGEDVVFIARGDHLQAMLSHGLRVDSIKGDFVIKPVQAMDDPAQAGTADVVLLGVKAWQIPQAAQAMKQLLLLCRLYLPRNKPVIGTRMANHLGTRRASFASSCSVSVLPIVNVFTGTPVAFCISATTSEESMPPERKAPSGTSEIIRLRTESPRRPSSSSSASSTDPGAVRGRDPPGRESVDAHAQPAVHSGIRERGIQWGPVRPCGLHSFSRC